MSGSGTFDGSSNLTITSELNYVPTLPHYDANDLAATGTYSQVTIDSRGRIINASTPTTLSAYGIADAQPLDSDLTSLASMTTLVSYQGSLKVLLLVGQLLEVLVVFLYKMAQVRPITHLLI